MNESINSHTMANQQQRQQFWMDCFKMALELSATPNAPRIYDVDCEIIDSKNYIFDYATQFADEALQCFDISTLFD